MPSTHSPRGSADALALTLRAVAVAAPVPDALAAAGHRATVLGNAGGSLHLAAGGFVVAATPRGGTLLANGIACADPPPELSPGSPVTVELRGEPALWDPSVPLARPRHAREVGPRGAAILARLGVAAETDPALLAAHLAGDDPGAPAPLEALLRSLESRDADPLAAACERLVGRGEGLTPRFDDVLAGVAGAVAALGALAGWARTEREAWLEVIRTAAGGDRTTSLSATLLDLAATGRLMEPACGVLDFRSGGPAWCSALRRLLATGHSTGPAYAAAIGAAMLLLGSTQ